MRWASFWPIFSQTHLATLFAFETGWSNAVQLIEILVLEQVCLRWSSKHFWLKKLVKSLLISNLNMVIY
jgi:hypothetical protein